MAAACSGKQCLSGNVLYKVTQCVLWVASGRCLFGYEVRRPFCARAGAGSPPHLWPLRDFVGSGEVVSFPKGEGLQVLIVKLNQGAWSGGIPGTQGKTPRENH